MKLEPEDIIESHNKAAMSTTTANKHIVIQPLDRSKCDNAPAITAAPHTNANPTLMKNIDISSLLPTSFQQSRTPSKKCLEMPTQGVCQPKAYNLPHVTVPLTYPGGGANSIPLDLANVNADIAYESGSGLSSVIDIKDEPIQDKDNDEILDKSKYLGKRLYIDDESKSDRSAKRKCVDDNPNGNVNFSPPMPTGPILTIIPTQISEEEKGAQPPMKKVSAAKRWGKNRKCKM